MILLILGLLFFGLCAIAAGYDIHSLRIPNNVNLAIAGLFVPAAIASSMPIEMVGGYVLVAACALLVSFGLFAFNIIGGGDAKMIPAVMLWMGPAASFSFLFYMALVGGGLALFLLSARRAVPSTVLPSAIRMPFEDGAGVPYGVAIAIGAFVAAPQSELLSEMLSQISVFG